MEKGTLIITLELVPEDQAYFNNLRHQHFPAHANYLDAHLTLFHKLPMGEPLITATLQALAQRPSFELEVQQLKLMGNCVAFILQSSILLELHAQMQQVFAAWLIRQDQQPLRPHITVQNKVTAFKAQQLHETLKGDFKPFSVRASGFRSWKYLQGPWKALESYPFSQNLPG